MNVERTIKRYWAKRGAKEIFGADWERRAIMTDEEAEERFDAVWKKRFEPVIGSAKVISPEEALELVPNDGRREHFRAEQEHRRIRVCGEELLVQIDPISGYVTQLWHNHPKKAIEEIKEETVPAQRSSCVIDGDLEDIPDMPGDRFALDEDSAEVKELLGSPGGEECPKHDEFQWLCKRANLAPKQMSAVLARINEAALAGLAA